MDSVPDLSPLLEPLNDASPSYTPDSLPPPEKKSRRRNGALLALLLFLLISMPLIGYFVQSRQQIADIRQRAADPCPFTNLNNCQLVSGQNCSCANTPYGFCCTPQVAPTPGPSPINVPCPGSNSFDICLTNVSSCPIDTTTSIGQCTMNGTPGFCCKPVTTCLPSYCIGPGGTGCSSPMFVVDRPLICGESNPAYCTCDGGGGPSATPIPTSTNAPPPPTNPPPPPPTNPPPAPTSTPLPTNIPTPVPAKIGDFVWNDSNQNGIQDTGEPGIPGVTINLLNTNGQLIATTTTDATGKYSFTVPPGSYVIQVIPPGGYIFSPTNQGSNTAIDSNTFPADGKTSTITVVAGQTDLTVDSGLYLGQCLNIKFYRNGQVVVPTTLMPGNAITIAVVGTGATKARIQINGGGYTETSTQNSAGEYTLSYTIPTAGVTNLDVNAQVFVNGVWR